MPSDPLPERVIARRRQVGNNVRAAREAKGLSQEKLGELSDLDRKTINRIEQATHGTSIDHLQLIADALDVPLAELVR